MTDDTYGERILDHARAPRHWGRVENANVHAAGDNPVCGDAIELWVRVEKDRLSSIGFEGKGCAISLAGASLLFEHAQGQPVSAVLGMNRETLFELLGLRVTTSRVKCATLGLVVLQDAVRARSPSGAL